MIENSSEELKNGGEIVRNRHLIRKFETDVAAYIGAAAVCQRSLENKPVDETLVEDIQTAKNNFYAKLDLFIQEHPTLPALIADQLPAINEMREKDWSKREAILESRIILKNIFDPHKN